MRRLSERQPCFAYGQTVRCSTHNKTHNMLESFQIHNPPQLFSDFPKISPPQQSSKLKTPNAQSDALIKTLHNQWCIFTYQQHAPYSTFISSAKLSMNP